MQWRWHLKYVLKSQSAHVQYKADVVDVELQTWVEKPSHSVCSFSSEFVPIYCINGAFILFVCAWLPAACEAQLTYCKMVCCVCVRCVTTLVSVTVRLAMLLRSATDRATEAASTVDPSLFCTVSRCMSLASNQDNVVYGLLFLVT